MSRASLENLIVALCRKPTQKVLTWGFFGIFLMHWVIKFEQVKEHGNFQELAIPSDPETLRKYPPFGIQTMEEFPDHGPYKIPPILHQTWKDTQIPRKLMSWVKSWVTINPNWEYYLWTDQTARDLINERHPKFLPVFDSYSENIRRADSLRYVVLYEFGGVYADMDVECLKPLDPVLRKYSCFMPQEPYEHPVLDGNFEILVINAVMGCRAKHPFMKLIIEQLPFFSHMWNVLDSTGPYFVTQMFNRYSRTVKSLQSTHEDAVYLAPAEYFFPTVDPIKFFWFRVQCGKFYKLSYIQKRACVNFKAHGAKRKPLPFSFTDHHWVHTYLEFRLSLKGPIDVHEIVPTVKFYRAVNTNHSWSV
ncbi:hypothetical protein ACJMK2_044486 [Sinanodonta woodiana]|uniref:Uncharacterized protein n=1 Tax=Sinanodonta woodiana TaxID=1069815 RepID=A0ABD3W082_SINWO